MAAFPTAMDLAARLRREVDGSQADALIGNVVDEIQGACPGWTLTSVEDGEVVVTGSGTSTLELPRKPAVSVSSVEDQNGNEVEGWTLRKNRLVRGSGTWSGTFTVTYTYGFDDDTRPSWLTSMVLKVAARWWVNPEQVMQKRRGDYSVSFGSSTEETARLTRWELALLARNGLRRTSR